MKDKLGDLTNLELELEFANKMYDYNGTIYQLAKLIRKSIPRYLYIRIIAKMRKESKFKLNLTEDIDE